MKFISSYFIGITSTLKRKKLVLMLYGFTLLFALVVAIPFKEAIANDIGQSMAAFKLLKEFDFSTYSNFMHLFGDTIRPLSRAALFIGIFYSIFFVFFSGGIISSIKKGYNSLSQFWADSWNYFPRFFRLFIYIFLTQIIVTLLVFFPTAAIIVAVRDSIKSEATYFYIVCAALIIYLFLLTILILTADYAKIMMVGDDALRPFRTMMRSLGYVFKHFFSVYGMNLLFILSGVVLFIIYFFVAGKIDNTSGFTIFIMFLVQQLLIICRIYLKISVYGGEVELVKKLS